MRRAIVLCLFLATQANGQASAAEEAAEGLLAKAKRLPYADKLGETGIGFATGACTGFVCKKVSSLVMSSAIVCAGVVGGSCLMGWTKPDDVVQRAEALAGEAANAATKNLGKFTSMLDAADGKRDGKVDFSDSKVALSRFAKSHAGLSAGFVGGLYAGWKIL
jgi:hypothetical protein